MYNELYALSTTELEKYLKDDFLIRTHFQGIYSFNEVKNIDLKEGNFVVLFKPHSESSLVGHWTVLFLNNSTFEYFDSLGINVEEDRKLIETLAVKNPVFSSSIPFQKSSTNSCGQFAIYFIYTRILDILENFFIYLAKYFSVDQVKNELTVAIFFKKLS